MNKSEECLHVLLWVIYARVCVCVCAHNLHTSLHENATKFHIFIWLFFSIVAPAKKILEFFFTVYKYQSMHKLIAICAFQSLGVARYLTCITLLFSDTIKTISQAPYQSAQISLIRNECVAVCNSFYYLTGR